MTSGLLEEGEEEEEEEYNEIVINQYALPMPNDFFLSSNFLDLFQHQCSQISGFCSALSPVERIFESEPRLLRLKSPVYVFGDFHGNMADLIAFSKLLWPLGMHLTPGSFLFLGDYVDRGQYSIEVLSYLFAQKIMLPDKVFLLRGNHELRAVNISLHPRFGDSFTPRLGVLLRQSLLPWAAQESLRSGERKGHLGAGEFRLRLPALRRHHRRRDFLRPRRYSAPAVTK